VKPEIIGTEGKKEKDLDSHSQMAGIISRGWEAGIKALNREAARVSAALTSAGPRLHCFDPGNVSLNIELRSHSKSMTDFVLVDGSLLEGLLDEL
jgi:hypothetical protein